MKRELAAVLILVVGAIAACLTWIPVCYQTRTYEFGSWDELEDRHARGVTPLFDYGPWHPEPQHYGGVRYTWAWDQWELPQQGLWSRSIPRPVPAAIRILWWPVVGEIALILLLGGGLLTWVVRRERRRAAA